MLFGKSYREIPLSDREAFSSIYRNVFLPAALQILRNTDTLQASSMSNCLRREGLDQVAEFTYNLCDCVFTGFTVPNSESLGVKYLPKQARTLAVPGYTGILNPLNERNVVFLERELNLQIGIAYVSRAIVPCKSPDHSVHQLYGSDLTVCIGTELPLPIIIYQNSKGKLQAKPWVSTPGETQTFAPNYDLVDELYCDVLDRIKAYKRIESKSV